MRRENDRDEQYNDAADDEFHRQVLIGAGRVCTHGVTAAEIGESAFQAVPDGRQRSKQTDDPAGGDSTRADVEHIGSSHVVRCHLGDGDGARRKRANDMFTEKFDRWNQNEIRENAARAHERADARTDDVANA